MIKESGGRTETPVKYVLVDYKCKHGHGISMHYPYELYIDATSKKKKKGE